MKSLKETYIRTNCRYEGIFDGSDEDCRRNKMPSFAAHNQGFVL